MQIISFPSHYQIVYINFDISSFSLISYTALLRETIKTNYRNYANFAVLLR